MRTKNRQGNKINIITLGCSKNMVDSEVLSGQLTANQMEVVHENKKGDHNIVVVNTCGFIDKAKEESVNTILRQVDLKKRGKLDKVYVTGCLSERYKNNLEAEIPEVDAFSVPWNCLYYSRNSRQITRPICWESVCLLRPSTMPT